MNEVGCELSVCLTNREIASLAFVPRDDGGDLHQGFEASLLTGGEDEVG